MLLIHASFKELLLESVGIQDVLAMRLVEKLLSEQILDKDVLCSFSTSKNFKLN